MRRRQRLNVTVQKYAPKWYAIFKSAHDLELAHDVGPTHDVSLAYIIDRNGYFGINDSCHSGQLPLMPKYHLAVFRLCTIDINRQCSLNLTPAKVTCCTFSDRSCLAWPASPHRITLVAMVKHNTPSLDLQPFLQLVWRHCRSWMRHCFLLETRLFLERKKVFYTSLCIMWNVTCTDMI